MLQKIVETLDNRLIFHFQVNLPEYNGKLLVKLSDFEWTMQTDLEIPCFNFDLEILFQGW